MKKIPVILDVDTGIDDALAMLLASSSEQLDILGISTVGGNVSLDKTFLNTCFVSDLLGLSTPIVQGKEKPLINLSEDASYVHGASGLGDIDLSNYTSSATISDQSLFDFYKHTLENAKKKVVIIATGPLTNIAAVLVSMPHLKDKIDYISIMGGAIEFGNTSPCSEFNIIYDPESAAIVFESGVDIVLAPLDVTYQAYFTKEDIESSKKNAVSDKLPFVGLLEYYLRFYQEKTTLPGAALHDSVSIAYVLDPSMFETQSMNGSVDISEDISRGLTILDKYDTMKKEKNIKLITKIFREKFVALTMDSLKKEVS